MPRLIFRRSRLTLCLVVAGAVDPGVVARAIDRLDRALALDRDIDRQPLDRLGRELLGAEGIGKLDDVVIALAKLGVAHRHLAVGPWRNGKHAGAIESAAHVLQERRIFLGADDLFVNASRLVLVHEPAGQLAAIDQKHKVLHGTIFGQREEEFRLDLNRPGVVKRLRDLNFRHLVANPGIDGDLANLVRPGDRHGRPSIDDEPLGPGDLPSSKQDQDGPDQNRPPTLPRVHGLSSSGWHRALQDLTLPIRRTARQVLRSFFLFFRIPAREFPFETEAGPCG